MPTLALVADLIFATRIRATAQALGRPLQLASTLPVFQQALAAGPPDQVIVDLSLPDAAAAIRAANAAGTSAETSHAAAGRRRPQIIGFYSHVQTDQAAAAREAGADSVLPRSAFVEQLPRLLAPRPDAAERAPGGPPGDSPR
ncbi:MAG: hypothetical protein U1A27_13760 [Phycisphaerae bacterium]